MGIQDSPSSSHHHHQSPVRNVLQILCVTLLVALLVNVIMSFDFTSVMYSNRTTADENTATNTLTSTLNSTLSSMLDAKLSTYFNNFNPPTTSTDNSTSTSVSATDVSLDLPSASGLRARQEMVNYSDVWMSEIEVDVLLRHLGEIRTYVEWGSGGSTRNFAQFATQEAHSIEHDLEWCKNMQASNLPAHVHVHCVSIPRGTDGWGENSAFEEGTYKQFKEYVDKIKQLNIDIFDFVLVDGRARVPAAVRSLSYISKDSVVVLHDAERAYTKRRGYHEVWKFFDNVDSVGGVDKQGLVVMRRKKEFDYLQGNHAAVQKILDEQYSE